VNRQPLVRTFLGKGSDYPRENEDTVDMAVDDSKSCWASQRRVEPISLSPMHKKASPSSSWSEVTYIGGGCRDRLEGDPPSAWRHFDRRSPIEGLDNRGPMPRVQEEATRGGDEGGRVMPHPISPSLEDADLVRTPVL
jgi:hypothetical protein